MTASSEAALVQAAGASVTGEIPQIGVKILSVNPAALDGVEAALANNPQVEYVEKNMMLAAEQLPNDPLYPSEWHLSQVQAPLAWELSEGSAAVDIAICDSGVDATHPDLAGKVLPGWNYYDGNDNTSDVYGHGTMVAGTAAAATNNTLGVAALGWQPRLIPVRVTDTNGYAYWSTLANCLTYAADRGAKAAVMSFAIFGGNTLFYAAQYLYNKGGLAVAAGGNDYAYHSDGDNPYIISVAATDPTDSRPAWSSYGPYIDLAAPGVGIVTTTRGGGYASVSGTSFAAPLTASLIALIFSANPALGPSQVLGVLRQSAVDLAPAGYDVYYGWGRIDAYQALQKAMGTTPLDTTAPVVSILSPSAGATVSGVTTISIGASDAGGIQRVEIWIDGKLKATLKAAPYDYRWNTRPYKDGAHTILIMAYDPAGNLGQVSIAVTVANHS